MAKQVVKDFDYYVTNNIFLKGSKVLFTAYYKLRGNDPVCAGEKFIDAMRLRLIAAGPGKVLPLVKRYGREVAATSLVNQLKMYLLDAEIARQSGLYIKAYTILTELQQKIESEMKRSVPPDALLYDLLSDANLLAGKCLARNDDHAMARIHYGLAYDHRHRLKHRDHFTDAQIRTAFARSYFDWRKMLHVDTLLSRAAAYYENLTKAKQFPYPHLYLSEVYVMQARYLSVKKRRKIRKMKSQYRRDREREKMYLMINEKLDQAEEIICLNLDRKHRRYAHILRLRAYFLLERAWEIIQERRGVISRNAMDLIEEADKLYQQEIAIRENFFHTGVHPTISRAYNYMTKAKIFQATYFGQTGQKRKFIDALSEAKKLNTYAIQTNFKLPDGWNITASKSNIKQTIKHQHPKLQEMVSDHQAFTSKRRKLEIQALSYEYAGLLNENKAPLFQSISRSYKECYEILTCNLKWFTSPDSRESFLKSFEPVQELYIEVCFSEFQQSEQNREETARLALIAMQHGSHEEDLISPVDHSKNKDTQNHYRLLRMLQTFTYRRLAGGKKKDILNQKKRSRREYLKKANTVIKGQKELIETIHGTPSKYEQHYDMTFSLSSITEGFNPKLKPGVAIALHFAQKHAYSIAVHDARRTNSPKISFRRLTEENNAYRGVTELKQLARNFNKTVSDIHNETLWKRTYSKLGQTHRLGWKKLHNDCLYQDTFIYDTKHPNLADRLNSRFLHYGYLIYRQVFDKLDIAPESRVYIGVNKYRWQRIPLRALPTIDPLQMFRQGETARFSDLKEFYVGTSQQLSVLPSIYELRRWSERSEPFPISDQAAFPVFTLAGGGNHHAIQDRLPNIARASADKLLEVFNYQYQRHFMVPPPKSMKIDATHKIKKEVIASAMEKAVIIYALLHTANESNEDGRRKLVFYAKKPSKRSRKPGFLQAFKWDKYCIYQEELASLNLSKAKLTFINGCSSADGRGQFGYIPYSNLTALYAAGSDAVIGSQSKIYTRGASKFADCFYKAWMDDDVYTPATTLGQAMYYAAKRMCTRPKKNAADQFTHPLHWGCHIQIGDMTARFKNCF